MGARIIDSPSAGWYVRNWKEAKAATAAGATVRLPWRHDPLDAPALNREMWEALDRRINARGALTFTGRKHADIYQTELTRDCRNIRDHVRSRLAVHQIMTPELRRRFGHYISSYHDF